MAFAGVALGQPLRHTDRMGVAPARVLIDMRTSRIGETKQARHLVEAFARGVVERGAHHVDMPCDVIDMQQ